MSMDCYDFTLSDYLIRRAGLSIQGSESMIRQCVLGVEYVHRLSVYHGDLKPTNLLIRYKDDPPGVHLAIADFGAARTLPPAKVDETCFLARASLPTSLFKLRDNDARGTVNYAAPETLGMFKDLSYGMPSDMFSVGAIGFYCLYGNHLSFGDLPKVVLEDYVEKATKLSSLQACPAVKFVDACLSTLATERPTARSAKDTWHFVGGSEETVQLPVPSPPLGLVDAGRADDRPEASTPLVTLATAIFDPWVPPAVPLLEQTCACAGACNTYGHRRARACCSTKVCQCDLGGARCWPCAVCLFLKG